jgi:dihydrofolate reductase
MMTKCSVYIATSLDGFISRRDGDIDWLNHFDALVPEGEDLGYARFISSVDALVMGRNTFEQVLTFGTWPYGDTPVVVLSHQLKALPEDVPETVSLSADEPEKLVQRLSARGWHHLYVDGGLTIQSFLLAGLIDEIIITVIPILLGEGKPLFGPLAKDLELELVESKAFDFGFVQSKYRIVKGA